MPRIHPFNRRDWLTALIVLAVAALLRLSDPHLYEFFHDEAMLSIMAQEMVYGRTLPLTGIVSSVGLPNSPVSVYLVAIPYLLGATPLGATLFIAGLNVAGVGLLWLIARRYFGVTVALIAGLAYALNPWAVMYSRKIWAQDFHTPFFLLALGLGLYGFVENKRWAQALCLPVLIFALQIHVAGWALLPVYFALMWLGRDRLSFRALALTGILATLVALPYSVGLADTIQREPERLFTVLSRSEISDGLSISAVPLNYAIQLATGTGIEHWLAPNQTAELLANVPPFSAVWGLMGVALLIGFVALWVEFRPLALIISAWLFAPLIVFAPTWTRVYAHYFVASLPVFALLGGVGVHALILLIPRRYRVTLRAVVLAGVLVALLSQGIWWRGALRYVALNHVTLGEGTSGYTTPLYFLEPVVQAVGTAQNVVVVTREPSPHFDADSARFQAFLPDYRCVRALPDAGMWAMPAGAFVAVIGEEAQITDDHPYLTDDTRTYSTREGGGAYRVTRFEGGITARDDDFTPLDGIRFANGVILDGYMLEDESVALRWRLPDSPSRLFFGGQAYEYQYFVHLHDAAGQRFAQVDARFWGGRHWCAGDTLYTIATPDMTLETLTQVSRLNIGFYQLPPAPQGDILPVDVLDIQGNPAGHWAEINTR